MAWPYSLSGDVVTQIFYFLSEKAALGGLQFQSIYPEPLQYFSESIQIFLLCTGINDNVIQVHMTGGVV